MAELYGVANAVARRCRRQARGLRAALPASPHTPLRSLLYLQLALLSLALGVLELHPPPTVVACDADVCASEPAATPPSTPAPAATAPATTDPTPAPRREDRARADRDADAVPAASAAVPEPDEVTGDGPDDGVPAPPRQPTATKAPTDVVGQPVLRFPPPQGRSRALGSRAQQGPEARRMPHEHYAEHATELIGKLPPLEMLERRLPPSPMTRGVAVQKERIAWLDGQANVTVEGFDAFAVDTSRNDAFADLPNYHDRIRPELFIVHWTGVGYRDVDHFVTSLKPYRVQYFLDHHAQVFELFEADDHKPAHALGANDFSQGVEIETGPFDGVESPLFSYTPEQIEQTIYLAVDFLRRNGLPVDETTLVGHYAADLIFSNPHYRPHSGQLVEPRIRKFDPPQELMQVIVAKAQALDAELGRP